MPFCGFTTTGVNYNTMLFEVISVELVFLQISVTDRSTLEEGSK